MKRIEFSGDDVFLAGTRQKVGEIQPSQDMCMDILLSNGCHVYGYYGTTDKHGEFHAFCRNSGGCGKSCFDTTNPKCRYNRETSSRAGYYADVDATESVW